MIHFWLRRLLIALGRFAGGLFLLIVAIEFSMLLSRTRGAESKHVAADLVSLVNGTAMWGGEGSTVSVLSEVLARIGSSSGILVIAAIIAVGLGIPLGIWVAKAHRMRAVLEGAIFPAAIAMWMPSFWIAGLVVIYLVNVWGQPAYGMGTSGVERWWRIFLPAAVIAVSTIGWQVRAVSQQIGFSMRAGHVRAAHIRGHQPKTLFFRGVMRNSLKPIIRGVDQALPAMLGALIVVEWVFRYPGLGAMTLESARESNFVGLMGCGVAMLFLIVSLRCLSEILHGLVDPQILRTAK